MFPISYSTREMWSGSLRLFTIACAKLISNGNLILILVQYTVHSMRIDLALIM